MKREFNEDHTPLGYLITFRCYGTWLHGNVKGSVDRHNNRNGALLIPPDLRWHRQNLRSLKEDPVKLNKEQRTLVTAAITETCELRKWLLHRVNVRSNHGHAVVTAGCGPSKILNALKANATREMGKPVFGCEQIVRGQMVAASATCGPKNSSIEPLTTWN